MVASLLRECVFVQMQTMAQNKFKLSVAGALHLGAKSPKAEQVNISLSVGVARKAAFAVDRGKRRGLQSVRDRGKYDG
ncbi:hypothetical protein [Bradyrhizobium lablabi]|uniref:hypothetical protein n=1 Tax=Bradyrhizobium lablabi TaxID=722472 RepID=UPI0012AB343E|nr:hypothetical protein [Bradyrhizobium lablabi]